jgi:hypothetical protein
MGHEVRLERDSEFTGELSLGLAEDGVLEFDDGRAVVADEAQAEAIADRYAAIEYPESDANADSDEDSVEDDGEEKEEEEGFDAALFVDRTPMDNVVEDIESGDYDDHLDAIAAAEREGRNRQGVADGVDARRE